MSFKPSQFYPFTVPAFGSYTLTVEGSYFKIMETGGPISIKSDWGELKGLIAGQGLESTPFRRMFITNDSASPVDVRIFIGDEKFIDGVGGTFNIGANRAPQSASFVNAQKTVTNASTQLLAANSNRQYLLIQNNDASAVMYVSFGVAATAAAGVRIVPGGNYELTGAQSTQAIFAIGSAANNPNVVTVEG